MLLKCPVSDITGGWAGRQPGQSEEMVQVAVEDGLERLACSCYGIVKAEFDLIAGDA